MTQYNVIIVMIHPNLNARYVWHKSKLQGWLLLGVTVRRCDVYTLEIRQYKVNPDLLWAGSHTLDH